MPAWCVLFVGVMVLERVPGLVGSTLGMPGWKFANEAKSSPRCGGFATGIERAYLTIYTQEQTYPIFCNTRCRRMIHGGLQGWRGRRAECQARIAGRQLTVLRQSLGPVQTRSGSALRVEREMVEAEEQEENTGV